MDISEVCAAATNRRVVIGDESAPPPPCTSDVAGNHIASVLESLPGITLLSTQEPVHVKGEVLALERRFRWMVEG